MQSANTPPALAQRLAMRRPDDTPVSEELDAWFTALAQVHGWTCAVCGQAIHVDSRFTYFSTGRCARCERLADEPQK